MATLIASPPRSPSRSTHLRQISSRIRPTIPNGTSSTPSERVSRYTGMPSWEKTLSEQDMWKLTSFISHMEKLPPAVQEFWKKSFGVDAPSGEEEKNLKHAD